MKDETSANLLFLYGPSGSGKTTLLQMIAESLHEFQSVLRVGSEQIVYEMEKSVAHQNFADFFDRYTLITNLLIDNLWILKSRPSAAKEIGRLIKARMARGNLTILASDLVYQEVTRALPAIGDCFKGKSAVFINMGQVTRGTPQNLSGEGREEDEEFGK